MSDFTIKHERTSTIIPVICNRCEEKIIFSEHPKYVRIYIDNMNLNLDENCYQEVMLGIMKFYEVFIKDQALDKARKAN